MLAGHFHLFLFAWDAAVPVMRIESLWQNLIHLKTSRNCSIIPAKRKSHEANRWLINPLASATFRWAATKRCLRSLEKVKKDGVLYPKKSAIPQDGSRLLDLGLKLSYIESRTEFVVYLTASKRHLKKSSSSEA
jgi:hypothetical protein